MKSNPTYIGESKIKVEENNIKGEYVFINNECYYKISNSNVMRPFFMSIVSDSNHWMFIASNGGLTAGRKDCDNALFPYYTDDKIIESAEITGSKTIFKINKATKSFLWEPFSNRYEGLYTIQQNLYKNTYGNKIIFEEINHDLGVTFSYEWNSSERFGFVKKSKLTNNTNTKIEVSIVDGIQNIIPFGLKADVQNSKSNLVDAYKKCELEVEIGLGIYALSAIIVDRAEPSEALKANIAWSIGLENSTYLISSTQLSNFRKGISITQELDVRAEKGAYFICSEVTLKPFEEKKWLLVTDVNKGASSLVEISEKLKNPSKLKIEVEQDIEIGTQNLIELTGNADGLQVTSDTLRTTRHFSNTLFNVMRGGIFDENYKIDIADFSKYISKANINTYNKYQVVLQQIPKNTTLLQLKEIVAKIADSNLKRLCFEYLPLKFSRRHGDPSRPWNKFSINTKNEDGSKILDYQGNWRDIFQNWETLAHSYPAFIDSMIHKFLNASTFEGYNPYRVTKDGFDWEIVEPDDPWSFIGYWGDHQIIYLLKFLEFAENHYPTKLASYFNEDLFVFANVPYKIKSYAETLKNPKDTILFDYELDKKINSRKKDLGADGALLLDKNEAIYNVNLIEKLLATVLAKVSNFIPEAGIWLNTQRPEWNDANNALVGNGVSMVTLYYLRRFITFFKKITENMPLETVTISEEMVDFFNETVKVLQEFQQKLSGKISDKDRKSIVDGLGNAGSMFRTTIYQNSHSGIKKNITKNELHNFFDIVIKYIDHTIAANKRKDNLYHSYNLMTVENSKEISISYLQEMLEGQVAILGSNVVSAKEVVSILDSMKVSALYRKDQNSYLLYPNKQLPRFVAKNNLLKEDVEKSELIIQLLKDGNKQIIEKDIVGNYHFNGAFNNVNSLKESLNKLPESYKIFVEKDKELLFKIFEKQFNHKSFTGRSGTFFGYEGLGSIYWHMVSKLVVAVQECCLRAIDNNEDSIIIDKLKSHYYELNDGIGVHKKPAIYGAFPTDPYSHTPAGKGAQQPGMTGQVKEDVLSRFGELGVVVENGQLHFKPNLLKMEEFLNKSEKFTYTDINKQLGFIDLDKNSLCFTYCQVPVVYQLSNTNSVKIKFVTGELQEFDSLKLTREISQQIFGRTGEIKQLIVSLSND